MNARTIFAAIAMTISSSILSTASAAPLKVATSFSILEDFVKNVGGSRVSVTTIVPADADTHTYQPTTEDARKLSGAKLVTDHDALGYFADRYGFEVVGTVIPSGTTTSEPSAKELAALTDAIKAAGVKAIFPENILNPKLAQSVAKETGTKVAPALYTDALGPKGSSGETFLKAFRFNVDTIVAALK